MPTRSTKLQQASLGKLKRGMGLSSCDLYLQRYLDTATKNHQRQISICVGRSPIDINQGTCITIQSPRKYNPSLTSMFNNLAHQDTVLDVALELFRHRALLGVLISALRWGKVDVNSRGFASEDLSVEALLSKINSGAVNLVQQQSRNNAVDLHSKLGTLDDVETADERVDDEGETNTVVNGDSISFVRDLDDGLIAASDEDRLVLLRGDFDDIARGVEVLDIPFVALKLLARRLARAHAFRLRLLARGWRLAAHSAGTLRYG